MTNLKGERRHAGALWATATMAVACALFFGSSALIKMSPLVLETIEIRGNTRTAPEMILSAAGLSQGQGLYEREIEEIQEDVAGLPWVKQVSVTRRMPDYISIEVTEWSPSYLIRLDERLYYFTRNGEVIEAGLNEGLDYPVITGLGWKELEGDRMIRQELLDFIALIEADSFEGRLEEIHFDREEGFALFGDFPTCSRIKFGRGELDYKFSLLKRLRNTLEKRGKYARTADLTMNDRIITRLAASPTQRGRK